MIGMIISGHGEFAPGLSHALEMIAGKQDALEVLPFIEGQDLKDFEEQMVQAAAKLKQQAEGVVFFTDLLGGTPFRTAMLASAQTENSAVVVGSNLPMVIELALMRAGMDDAREMALQAKTIGREGIDAPELPASANNDDDGDGI